MHEGAGVGAGLARYIYCLSANLAKESLECIGVTPDVVIVRRFRPGRSQSRVSRVQVTESSRDAG
jgi:hypothetical protein